VIPPLSHDADITAANLERYFFSWLVDVADQIYVVTGDFPVKVPGNPKVHIVNVKPRQGSQQSGSANALLSRAIRELSLQISLSYRLIRPAMVSQVVGFAWDGTLVIPMLLAKLLRRKVVLFVTGSPSEIVRAHQGNRPRKLNDDIEYRLILALEKMAYTLADRLLLLSGAQAKQVQRVAGASAASKSVTSFFLPVDTRLFRVVRPLWDRRDVIGYIGRFSNEKGIRNFVEAIPLLIERERQLEFIICGDGTLRNQVVEVLTANNVNYNVRLSGWVAADELSSYLNTIKLLVLPSYTEGLPRIVLQAMACGTPVLATPVGAVPDVVKNDETGFVLDDNSPKGIADRVLEILNHPNLEGIAQDGQALIEKEYSLEAALAAFATKCVPLIH